MTLLAREANGRRRSLRISYYAGGPAWGTLTNASAPPPSDHESFLGDALSVEALDACLNCHSTRFRAGRDPSGPETADKGIGCERCHGPGENHVKAIEAGFPSPAVARPKLATPANG